MYIESGSNGMSVNKELMKGSTALPVLSVISQEDMYGSFEPPSRFEACYIFSSTLVCFMLAVISDGMFFSAAGKNYTGTI